MKKIVVLVFSCLLLFLFPLTTESSFGQSGDLFRLEDITSIKECNYEDVCVIDAKAKVKNINKYVIYVSVEFALFDEDLNYLIHLKTESCRIEPGQSKEINGQFLLSRTEASKVYKMIATIFGKQNNVEVPKKLAI